MWKKYKHCPSAIRPNCLMYLPQVLSRFGVSSHSKNEIFISCSYMKEYSGLFIIINVSMPKHKSLFCDNLMQFHYLLVNVCLIVMGLKFMMKEESGKACFQDLSKCLFLSYNTHSKSNVIAIRIVLKT